MSEVNPILVYPFKNVPLDLKSDRFIYKIYSNLGAKLMYYCLGQQFKGSQLCGIGL